MVNQAVLIVSAFAALAPTRPLTATRPQTGCAHPVLSTHTVLEAQVFKLAQAHVWVGTMRLQLALRLQTESVLCVLLGMLVLVAQA